jgi:hypothetical protein
MNENVDVDRWQRLWQSRADGPDASDLYDRIVRESRRRQVALIGPVLVTVAIGGMVLMRALTSRTAFDIAVAIETWLFIAVVWAISVRIDRHHWRPLGNTTAAFVDLSIHRCEGDLEGLRVALVLWVVQLIALTALRQYFAPVSLFELLTAWPVMILGWFGLPALVTGVRWYGRRKRDELRRLIELRRQLVED